MHEPPLSVAGAAAEFGVDTKTIRRMIGRGDLIAYKVGSLVKIDCAEIERYKAAYRITPKTVIRRTPSKRSKPKAREGSARALLLGK